MAAVLLVLALYMCTTVLHSQSHQPSPLTPCSAHGRHFFFGGGGGETRTVHRPHPACPLGSPQTRPTCLHTLPVQTPTLTPCPCTASSQCPCTASSPTFPPMPSHTFASHPVLALCCAGAAARPDLDDNARCTAHPTTVLVD